MAVLSNAELKLQLCDRFLGSQGPQNTGQAWEDSLMLTTSQEAAG